MIGKDYKFISISDDTNVFVVGDIHACYTMLMNKLNDVGFDFNKDLLIAVGDLIDMGSENEKCVGLLNEKWFISVKGNHEDFCYKGMLDYGIEFYHKMSNNGGEWFYKLPENIRYSIGNTLNDLPVMLEVSWRGKNFGFVHADVPVEDWNLLVEMVINDDTMINSDRSVIDHCLWSRNVVEMEDYNVAGIHRVFLGHTVLPEIKNVGNCTFLDTGGVFKKYDNGYELSVVRLEDYL